MATDIEARLDREWETLGGATLINVESIVEHAGPESASRRAVLVELEDTRLSFAELRLRLESSDGARLATRHWTVRQVVAHLASWAARTRIELEALVEGMTLPESVHFEREGGPRAWNQRQVDEREGRATAVLFEEIDTEITRTADIVAGMPQHLLHRVVELPRTAGEPAVAWRLPIAAMVLGSCWHARYHLARLESTLTRTP